MKNTFTQRLVLGLLALFLLAYVALQGYRYFTNQYQTETAYSYTVEESARVIGIALRDEVVLDERVNNGFAAYIPADGTKVSKGSPIAEVYKSEAEAANVRRLRELENRCALLEKSQDPANASFTHTDVLNKQIFSEVGNVIDAVNADDLSELSEMSDELLVLMNTRQIATGKQDDFNGAIERLQAEQEYLKGQISQDASVIKSPRQGYFIRTIDGLEGRANLKNLGELTPNDVLGLMNAPAPKKNDGRVGKLMVSHNWYFAARITEEELPKYRVGGAVTLDFNISGVMPVPATICNVNTYKDQTDAVVVFRCDYINEALVNLRSAQADVSFKSVRGLRVSSSAIRFIGMDKGVYTIMGGKLVFKPVEVIYEAQGFVLCREIRAEDPEFNNSLQQYDEVVTGGRKLYDDKRIG